MLMVEPMPHELAAGHQGRIRWVNGCLDDRDLLRLITHELVARGFDPIGKSRLAQLALMSEMDISEYARKHSMLGVVPVATMDGGTAIYGPGGTNRDSKRPGMSCSINSVAFCCHECIKDDFQKVGYSWYRRFHHVLGAQWCVAHDCKLLMVDARRPFDSPPQRWLQLNKLVPIKTVVDVLPQAGFLRRYIHISFALLERGSPFILDAIRGALARQAFEIGLRPTLYGRRPTLLSDHLSAQTEDAWLRAHIANWETKKPFEYFSKIDGVLVQGKKPWGSHGYVMAMAALYDTAEDAMQYVSLADSIFKVVSRSRSTEYWQNEVERRWVSCQEFADSIAKKLNVNGMRVAEALLYLGLPNMHSPEPSGTWAAVIRFLYGEKIATACIVEKVERGEVRALLRICCGNVLRTISTLRKEFVRRFDRAQTGTRRLVYFDP